MERISCNRQFKSELRRRISEFEVRSATLPQGGVSAAVAVIVTDLGFGAELSGMPVFTQRQSDSALLLTRRSAKLKRHSGQWAFPGGRIDGNESPEEAALRETKEEIGLKLSNKEILGRLDDFVTRSGFLITPVVMWAGSQKSFSINPSEVESIHRIPITEFMRDDAPMLDQSEGGNQPVLRMPVGDNWIAAPTAAILYQFREVCIAGNMTRVAHYDQPKFAWS